MRSIKRERKEQTDVDRQTDRQTDRRKQRDENSWGKEEEIGGYDTTKVGGVSYE